MHLNIGNIDIQIAELRSLLKKNGIATNLSNAGNLQTSASYEQVNRILDKNFYSGGYAYNFLPFIGHLGGKEFRNRENPGFHFVCKYPDYPGELVRITDIHIDRHNPIIQGQLVPHIVFELVGLPEGYATPTAKTGWQSR
jgi:hypothetical protein